MSKKDFFFIGFLKTRLPKLAFLFGLRLTHRSALTALLQRDEIYNVRVHPRLVVWFRSRPPPSCFVNWRAMPHFSRSFALS